MSNRPFRLFSLCVGTLGLAGSFLMVWLAPKFIAWYFQPPTHTPFDCREPISWALSHYQNAQLFGLLGGAVLGLVLFFVLLSRSKRTAAPSVHIPPKRPL